MQMAPIVRWRGGSWLAWPGLLLVSCLGCAAKETGGAEAPRATLTELDALQHDLDVGESLLSEQLQRQRRQRLAADETARREAPAHNVAPISEQTRPEPAPTPPPAPSKAPAATPLAPDDAQAAGAPAGAPPAQEASPSRAATIGSACDLVCRALASMRRSADGICSLTSETHERCATARARVQSASRQVAEAGCACRS